MYTSVTILTIVYTIVLLYIYIRYNLDAKDKLKYDVEYAKTYSLGLDIKIIFLTVFNMIHHLYLSVAD